MLNVVSLLPHCKKDSKVESKSSKGATLNELVELKGCSSCLFFEVNIIQKLWCFLFKFGGLAVLTTVWILASGNVVCKFLLTGSSFWFFFVYILFEYPNLVHSPAWWLRCAYNKPYVCLRVILRIQVWLDENIGTKLIRRSYTSLSHQNSLPIWCTGERKIGDELKWEYWSHFFVLKFSDENEGFKSEVNEILLSPSPFTSYSFPT